MIAFARDYLLRKRKHTIRLGRPSNVVLVTGADRERIDVVVDRFNRIERLIIHTRATAIKG